MKNKGFTLIELLAIIALLSLLMLLVVPNVIEQTRKKEKQLKESEKKILYVDAGNYVRNNNYNIKEGNVFCVSIGTLINEGATSIDAEDFSEKIIKVSVDTNDNFIYSMVDNCTTVNES